MRGRSLKSLAKMATAHRAVTEPELTSRLLLVTDYTAAEFTAIWKLLREHEARLDREQARLSWFYPMPFWRRMRWLLIGR